jgi:export-related chaperone CsaA
MITWADFEKIDIRAGTIIAVQDFPEARNPSYKLTIDFGSLGIKQSSAQITRLYTKEALLQKQIIAILNFPPKQIANFFSECLVLGVLGNNKDIIMLHPEQLVENGSKIA